MRNRIALIYIVCAASLGVSTCALAQSEQPTCPEGSHVAYDAEAAAYYCAGNVGVRDAMDARWGTAPDEEKAVAERMAAQQQVAQSAKETDGVLHFNQTMPDGSVRNVRVVKTQAVETPNNMKMGNDGYYYLELPDEKSSTELQVRRVQKTDVVDLTRSEDELKPTLAADHFGESSLVTVEHNETADEPKFNDLSIEVEKFDVTEDTTVASAGKIFGASFGMGLLFAGVAGASSLAFYDFDGSVKYQKEGSDPVNLASIQSLANVKEGELAKLYENDAGRLVMRDQKGFDDSERYYKAVILSHVLQIPLAGGGAHLGGHVAGGVGKGWTAYFGALLGSAAGYGMTYALDKLGTNARPYAVMLVTPVLSALGGAVAYTISHHIHRDDNALAEAPSSKVRIQPTFALTPDYKALGLDLTF